MTRTPMEMSAYRMARRHGLLSVEFLFGDWLFAKRGRGREAMKAHKKLIGQAKESRVLLRRMMRKGSTVFQ